MSAINIRINDQLNQQLISMAKTMNLPKSYLIRQAIKNYMEQLKEDVEDIAAAEAILANSSGKTISFEEIEAKYGLAD